jgi:hypothetical protein
MLRARRLGTGIRVPAWGVLVTVAACGGQDGAARDPGPAVADTAASSGLSRRPDVIFVGTPPHVVRQMLALADVGPGDTLFDLGSGDGRIVIEGARRGARGVGIDIDTALVAQSRRNAESAGVEALVEFRHDDLFATDLRSATAVTLYLLPQLNVKLRPKLFDELRPGTPVVSHSFPMADWIPDSSVRMRGTQLFVWYIPADVAGEWEVTVGAGASAERWSMQLTQDFQAVSGRVKTSSGGTIRLTRARLRGATFAFTLADSTRRLPSAATVRGRVRGDTLVAAISNGGWRAGTPLRAVRRR